MWTNKQLCGCYDWYHGLWNDDSWVLPIWLGGGVMTIEEYKELMKKDVLKIGLDVDEEENNSEEAE